MSWSKTLEEDLRWREAELASLKRITRSNSENEIVYRCMLRASWTLLYAHYEGFTKFCWELLFDQIQGNKVIVEKLRKDFSLLALEKHFRILRANLSSAMLWKFFQNDLPNVLQCEATFDPKYRLNTESNLWPEVFERECARVGIASKSLEGSRTRIQFLVSRRNDIAHGKKMTISSVDEYVQYEEAVLLIMHDLAIQVLDILEKQSFLEEHGIEPLIPIRGEQRKIVLTERC